MKKTTYIVEIDNDAKIVTESKAQAHFWMNHYKLKNQSPVLVIVDD